VYSGDGATLLLTHFATVGSHPQMRSEPGSDTNRIQCHCVRGAAGVADYACHAHRATITIVGRNHIPTVWHSFEHGREKDTKTLNMIRTTD